MNIGCYVVHSGTGRMIYEWWVRKDVEVSGHYHFKVIIATYIWKAMEYYKVSHLWSVFHLVCFLNTVLVLILWFIF